MTGDTLYCSANNSHPRILYSIYDSGIDVNIGYNDYHKEVLISIFTDEDTNLNKIRFDRNTDYPLMWNSSNYAIFYKRLLLLNPFI